MTANLSAHDRPGNRFAICDGRVLACSGRRSRARILVLVGAKASIMRMKPFAEIKYTTQGKDGVVLTLGTRFHLFD